MAGTPYALDGRTLRLVAVAGAAVVAAVTAGGVLLAARFATTATGPTAAAAQVSPHTPSAADVAWQLAGAVNARSVADGSRARIGHVSCLEGSPGSYMCSYVRTVPGKGSSCAVAMLRWTPAGESTFAVGAAGRVPLAPATCGPVTHVLHVLGTSR